jgi:hypothetical protein
MGKEAIRQLQLPVSWHRPRQDGRACTFRKISNPIRAAQGACGRLGVVCARSLAIATVLWLLFKLPVILPFGPDPSTVCGVESYRALAQFWAAAEAPLRTACANGACR